MSLSQPFHTSSQISALKNPLILIELEFVLEVTKKLAHKNTAHTQGHGTDKEYISIQISSNLPQQNQHS